MEYDERRSTLRPVTPTAPTGATTPTAPTAPTAPTGATTPTTPTTPTKPITPTPAPAAPATPPQRAPTPLRPRAPSADEVIAGLAARQHGVVARGQLLAEGVTDRMIHGRLEAGVLISLHRGVYLLGSLRGALEPPRAREMAAVLACGPEAFLSHRSMGRVWGFLPPSSRKGTRNPTGTRKLTGAIGALDLIDVSVPGRRRHERAGVRLHRRARVERGEVTQVDGIPGTVPWRTLVDLSTVLGPKALNRAAARAVDLGLVRAAELERIVARRAGRPGAPALRVALDAGLTLTRSEAEERFLALVEGGGLPSPEVNVGVAGREVDFLWRRERLAVEVDGYRFHGAPGRFESDRRRDAELTAATGINVLRVTWRHLVEEPNATLVRLAQSLARASPSPVP